MENYFVITNSDGDTHVETLTKGQLLERLQENYWGERKFLNRVPNETDTNYWAEGILIIKGEVVTPQPIETITEYDIK